jgi:Na+-transporting NADH:ubiquinone oxidoreductase subunit A
VVANPEDKPKAIFVSAFNSMPLSQDFEYALKGQEKEFQAGLDALSKIAKVYLGISARQTSTALTAAKSCEVNVFDGPAPAGNVGVQINHVDPINKGEIVWTMGAEEVIFVGRLMLTGKVDLTRTVALAGSEVKKPAYFKMLVGQKLSTLLAGQIDASKSLRIINGNVMTGLKTTADGFLGAHATEVNVIPEGDHADEFLGWIAPRFNTFSTHRSYFSWLLGKKKEYVMDARIKGGERHMIMSGEYDKVFPMDIYAGYLVKAIIAGDIDRQEALGIYEVAPEDFAIAEFVDSSKLELQRIVREGLDILRKENA